MSSESDEVARNAWLFVFKTRKFTVRHDDDLEKGRIIYTDFKAIVRAQFAGRSSKDVARDARESLLKAFKKLDLNSDGYLSRAELTRMLTKRWIDGVLAIMIDHILFLSRRPFQEALDCGSDAVSVRQMQRRSAEIRQAKEVVCGGTVGVGKQDAYELRSMVSSPMVVACNLTEIVLFFLDQYEEAALHLDLGIYLWVFDSFVKECKHIDLKMACEVEQGDPMSEDEVAAIFKMADRNGDGRLDFEEFASIFESTLKASQRAAKRKQDGRASAKHDREQQLNSTRQHEDAQRQLLGELEKQRQAVAEERDRLTEQQRQYKDEVRTLCERVAQAESAATMAKQEAAEAREKARHEAEAEERARREAEELAATSAKTRALSTAPGPSPPSLAVPGGHELQSSASDTNLLHWQGVPVPAPPAGLPPVHGRRNRLRNVRDSGNVPVRVKDVKTGSEASTPAEEKRTEAEPSVTAESTAISVVMPTEPCADPAPEETPSNTQDQPAPASSSTASVHSLTTEPPIKDPTHEVTEQKATTSSSSISISSISISSAESKADEKTSMPAADDIEDAAEESIVDELADQNNLSAALDDILFATTRLLKRIVTSPQAVISSASLEAAATEQDKESQPAAEPDQPGQPEENKSATEAKPEAAQEDASEVQDDDENQPSRKASANRDEDSDSEQLELLVTEMQEQLGETRREQANTGGDDSGQGEDDKEDSAERLSQPSQASISSMPAAEKEAVEAKETEEEEEKEENAKVEDTPSSTGEPAESSQADGRQPKDDEKGDEQTEQKGMCTLSSAEIPSTSELKDWLCMSFKGCIFANDASAICTHQYLLTVTKKTRLFGTLTLKGPAKPIDVGIALAKIKQPASKDGSDEDINSAPELLEAVISNAVQDDAVCVVADVDPGEYVFSPFTSCAKLESVFSSPDRVNIDEENTESNGEMLTADEKMLPRVKAAFEEVFRRHDLDGSGGLDRDEYTYFHERCGEDSLGDEDWQVIIDNFTTNPSGELTLNGFLQLQMAILRDTVDSNNLESWRIIDAMGYNRKLELVEAWPFSCEVNMSSDDEASVSVYELTPDPTIADGALEYAACRHGDKLQLSDDTADSSTTGALEVYSLPWGVGHCETIVAWNRGSDSVSVTCDLSDCSNIVSSRHQTNTSDVLVAGETKILHHLVADSGGKEAKVVCKVSSASA
ncbi:uncharacterized protein LOC135820065 [Sycon ciliatum]|uniref:uncharacterized protein LOC135820065 n=1 Tax=Sycon ciliatum TaxID=27933 RepID=UPI0031F68E49